MGKRYMQSTRSEIDRLSDCVNHLTVVMENAMIYQQPALQQQHSQQEQYQQQQSQYDEDSRNHSSLQQGVTKSNLSHEEAKVERRTPPTRQINIKPQTQHYEQLSSRHQIPEQFNRKCEHTANRNGTL